MQIFQRLSKNMWTGDLFKTLFSNQESTMYIHLFSGFMLSGLPLTVVILVLSSRLFQSADIQLFYNVSHPKSNNSKANPFWHHIPLCLLHTRMCSISVFYFKETFVEKVFVISCRTFSPSFLSSLQPNRRSFP